MPSIFNTVRAALYGMQFKIIQIWYTGTNSFFVVTVLVFTVICLAMAAHFQTVLAASDLSEFSSFIVSGNLGAHNDLQRVLFLSQFSFVPPVYSFSRSCKFLLTRIHKINANAIRAVCFSVSFFESEIPFQQESNSRV